MSYNKLSSNKTHPSRHCCPTTIATTTTPVTTAWLWHVYVTSLDNRLCDAAAALRLTVAVARELIRMMLLGFLRKLSLNWRMSLPVHIEAGISGGRVGTRSPGHTHTQATHTPVTWRHWPLWRPHKHGNYTNHVMSVMSSSHVIVAHKTRDISQMWQAASVSNSKVHFTKLRKTQNTLVQFCSNNKKITVTLNNAGRNYYHLKVLPVFFFSI